MRRLVGFVLLLLALGTLRTVGCGDESPCGDCSDGNPCTRDYCESYIPGGGFSCDPEYSYRCDHDRVADGTGCSVDGRSGACVSGRCDPCAIVECPPDENECTTEYCSRGDCLSKPVTDGTPCTFKGLFPGVCVSGFCGKDLCADVICDDDDVCTNDRCDYVDGTCEFTPVACDDGDPCTEDACDPVLGCISTPVEDGTACGSRGWVCVAGKCVIECESPEDCDDGNKCTQDRCDFGACEHTAVEDGTECEGRFGICEAGSCVAPCDLIFDEEYQCPIIGLEDLFCCPGSENCRGDCTVPECQTPVDCDDENECTEDHCSYENGTCYFTPVACNDHNPCTEDACDPAEGCVFTAVEDETECGSLAWCIAGECVPVECWSPEDCDDGNDCTEDMCSGVVCEYPPAEDGTPCAGGTCLGGACELTGSVLPCTEQGIRNAVAAGGGPYTFNCNGPTTVWTEAEIRINNDVILDGEGNLTIDANQMHRVFSVVSDTTAELRGMTVTGGARAYTGGGIHNVINATLTLTNSTVSGNTADEDGGGIYNSGTLTLTNSTVSGNTADDRDPSGGGIYNNSGTATLTNSTVSGNTAKYGGGIFNGHATLTLTNSTVSGNRGPFAAGLYNWGTLTLTNSTVSGNDYHTVYNTDALTITNTVFVGLCSGPSGVVTSTSGGYNIESPGDTCRFDEPTDLTEVTAAELNLGPLAENGGPTKTHALEPGSPAIDLIPEAGCVVDTDQRGKPRPETGGDECDVGSFERQSDDP
jgi:hypothetical protein